jgi:hypothetical protein
MVGSPSQRLRATLFISWQQNTDQKQNFDDWYQERIEQFINQVKKEMEPPISAYEN